MRGQPNDTVWTRSGRYAGGDYQSGTAVPHSPDMSGSRIDRDFLNLAMSMSEVFLGSPARDGRKRDLRFRPPAFEC